MPTLDEAVSDFLAQKRIAVAGVSRSKRDQPANLIYRKLRDHGYEVFAVNPAADEVEGDRCYANVGEIPGTVDGVVAAAAPEATLALVNDCVAQQIPRVWIHRSIGQGSASDEAVALGKANGLTVIPAGCPMMYCEPDVGHRCMRWFYSAIGRMPRSV